MTTSSIMFSKSDRKGKREREREGENERESEIRIFVLNCARLQFENESGARRNGDPRSSINNYTDGAIFIRMYTSMIYHSYREFSRKRNIEF